MAYFCDSSAVVKCYVTEAGSSWMQSLADPNAGNELFAALIMGAEVVAALTRRARGGITSPADLQTALQAFRFDFSHVLNTLDVTESLILRSMDVAEKHALRGYDAVQLASALTVQDDRDSKGLPPLTFVSADRELLAAAAAEGLTTDDPNAHP